jgi:DNA-directed RNA polymerase I subunit RPA2
MAKQTMGTSVLNWDYRFDNKLYRILHSQKPLVRTKYYHDYHFDDYNSGTNAVVAVLSYTGYDMEDAMIINKSSYEQGFGHGCVYKTVEYLLSKDENRRPPKYKLFKEAPAESQKMFEIPPNMESDGVVRVGAKLKKMTPLLILYEVAKKSFKTFYNKESEACSVESVLLTGGEGKSAEKVLVKLRFDRRPVIGDKFSSRHGQKGVLSMLWPKVDMPFTETGMTPDVIINPNAFPSRMTIGMLIESMAAKSSALEGRPFEYEAF